MLRAPTEQHKPSLTPRGVEGKFLGRSRDAKGCYAVMVDGRVVHSASVLVNEEYFPWLPADQRKQPLASVAHAARAAQPAPLIAPTADVGAGAAPKPDKLCLLSLFSGEYSRTDGLAAALRSMGWSNVEQFDNDGERGGGWDHDLLRDETYAALRARDAQSAGAQCLPRARRRVREARLPTSELRRGSRRERGDTHHGRLGGAPCWKDTVSRFARPEPTPHPSPARSCQRTPASRPAAASR